MPRKLIAILSIGVTAIAGLYVYNDREIPFTSSDWKTNVSKRPRMIDSLLNNHNLVGAPRESIDDLLGVPSTSRDSVIDDRYVYWAGTDGVIDDMWLEIRFADDRVVDVRYVPD